MSDISFEPATGTLPTVQKSDVSRASREAGKAESTREEASRSVKSVSDEEERKLPSEESVEAAVDKLRSYSDKLNRDLEFSIDDSSGRTVVTVKDSGTDEVIRQIPSEEALRLANRVDDGGVSLFDARA